MEAFIVRRFRWPDRRAAGGGRHHIRHRRQGSVIDDDLLCGILRLGRRFRDDRGHGIANMAHGIGRQHPPGRLHQRPATAALTRRHATQQPRHVEIGRRQHRQHPRHGPRRGRVDAPDARRGVRGAQDVQPGGIGRGEVIHEPPGAAQEAAILHPPQRRADAVDGDAHAGILTGRSV